MPRPHKGKKKSNPSAAATSTNIPPGQRVTKSSRRASEVGFAKEFEVFIGGLCSTRMDIAFIAAEMLLHIGRGQMAAQLGHNYSHEDNDHLDAVITEANIFEYPANPNQESIVEKLFLGFVKSVANNDPALKKQRWKTPGNSDLPFIAALSFLVGNLAWQNNAANTPLTRQHVKDAFDAVAGKHCPAIAPKAGGGPWCEWMDL